MLFEIIPTGVFAIEANPDYDAISQYASSRLNQKNCFNIVDEITTERDAFTKVYILEDGSYYSVSSSTPIHEYVNGEWVDIYSIETTPQDTNEATSFISSLSALPSTNNMARGGTNVSAEYDSDDFDMVFTNGATNNTITGYTSMWIRPKKIPTTAHDSIISTVSANLIVTCQNTNASANNPLPIRAYEVLTDWNEATKTYVVSGQSFKTSTPDKTLKVKNKVLAVNKISAVGDYTWDISDIYNKWERGASENNGIILTCKNNSKYATIGGFSLTRHYRIIGETDESYSYKSIEMGRAGTVYVNEYTNTLKLERSEIGVAGGALSAHIYRVFDFGKTYNHINFSGVASRWNFESTLAEITSDTIIWKTLDGRLVKFKSPGSTDLVVVDKRQKWTSEDGEYVLWVYRSDDNKNVFDKSFIEETNKVNSTFLKYTFNSYDKVCEVSLNKDENGTTTKLDCLQIIYDDTGSILQKVIDGAGRCYQFHINTPEDPTKSAFIENITLYKNRNYAEIAEEKIFDGEAVPEDYIVKIGDVNYTVNYQYTTVPGSNGFTFIALSGASYPDGQTVNYTYDYSLSEEFYNGYYNEDEPQYKDTGRLIQITDNDGYILTIKYADSFSGRVKSLIKSKNGTVIEKIDFDSHHTYQRTITTNDTLVETIQYNTNLDVMFRRDNNGTEYYLTYNSDNEVVQITIPEDAENLIANGNFDNDADYNWLCISDNGETEILADDEGNNRMWIEADEDDVCGVTKKVTINGQCGETFAISATGEVGDIIPLSNLGVGVEIYELNSAGNIPSNSVPLYSWYFDNTITNEKQYRLGSFVLEKDVEKVAVCLVSAYQSDDVYFDDVKFYRALEGATHIDNMEDSSNSTGCGTNCPNGENCSCNCESIESCSCSCCNSFSNEILNYRDDNTLSSIEYQNSDGNKTMITKEYYDSNGNYLTSKVDENENVTQYNYDPYNGLLMSETIGNSTVNYSYTPVGMLSKISQEITPITSNAEASKITISNEYAYAGDKVSSITHNGFTYNFIYNDYGECQVVKVGEQLLVSYTYNDNQSLNKITYGNGDIVNYEYSNGQISKIYNNDNLEVVLYEYEYNDDGSLKKITDNVNGFITEYDCTFAVPLRYGKHAGETQFDIIVYRIENPRDIRYVQISESDGVYEYYAEEEYTVYDTVTNYDCETGITTSSTRTDYSYNSSIITISSTDAFGRRINPENSISVNDGSWNEPISASNTILQKYGSGLPAAKSETYYYYDDTDTQAFSEVTGYSNTVSGFRNYTTYRNLDYLYDLSLKWGDDYQFISENDNKIVKVYSVSDSETLVAQYEYNDAGQIVREDYKFNELNNSEEFYLYTYDVCGKVNSVNPRGYYYDTDKETILTEYNYSTVGITFDETDQNYYSFYISKWSKEYSYEYDEHGNITSVYSGLDESTRTLVVRYQYDEANQLIREDNNSLNKTFTMTYDAGGNVTSKNEYAYTTEELGAVVNSTTYSYKDVWKDELDTLTVKTKDAEGNDVIVSSESIEYDEIGNPLSVGEVGHATQEYRLYEWNGKQLVSCTIHNKDNDPKTDVKYEYTYNSEGLRATRLAHTYETDSNGNILYNEDGSPKSSDTKTEYYWEDGKLSYLWLGPDEISTTSPDEDELQSSEKEQHASLTIKYLYDENGEPYGMRTNDDGMFYFVKNLQGDVEQIVAASDGVRMITYKYDAWGNMTYTLNLSSIETALASLIMLGNNVITYRGYNYDYETNLYYLQSRYYSPEWGRFLNADSFCDTNSGVLGTNMFAYGLNNPVNNTDPTGYAAAAITVGGITISYGAIIAVVATLLYLVDPNIREAVNQTVYLILFTAPSTVFNAVKRVAQSISDARKKPKTKQTHEHHIVAQKDRRAATSRSYLSKVGLTTSHQANKVHLNKNFHQHLHTNAYHSGVESLVKTGYNKGGKSGVLASLIIMNAILKISNSMFF